MFKTKLLEVALHLLAKWFENPKRDKVREFLINEKTQAVMATIFGAYFALVDEIDEQEEA